MIELFDLGEKKINLGTAGRLARRDQLRQAVQSAAEHEIYIGGAPDDLRTFLARRRRHQEGCGDPVYSF